MSVSVASLRCGGVAWLEHARSRNAAVTTASMLTAAKAIDVQLQHHSVAGDARRLRWSELSGDVNSSGSSLRPNVVRCVFVVSGVDGKRWDCVGTLQIKYPSLYRSWLCIQASPPCSTGSCLLVKVGSDIITCLVAPDFTFLIGRAPTSSRVPCLWILPVIGRAPKEQPIERPCQKFSDICFKNFMRAA
jgi:hypothetical protein